MRHENERNDDSRFNDSSYLQGSRPYHSSDYNFKYHGEHENLGGRGSYPEQYGNQYQNDIRRAHPHASDNNRYTDFPERHPQSQGELNSNYYQDRFQRNHGLSSSSSQRESDYFDDLDRSTHGHKGKGPKGYQRSDARIQEDVCEKLMDSPYIDAENIEVKVSKGCITLTGFVENKRVKYFVEDIAETCSGVKEVRNEISLRKKDYTDTGVKNIHQNQ